MQEVQIIIENLQMVEFDQRFVPCRVAHGSNRSLISAEGQRVLHLKALGPAVRWLSLQVTESVSLSC